MRWFARQKHSPASAPEGTRLYAIGDIHGSLEQLKALQAAILADSDKAPARRVVIYLGDYIDRGPGSQQVVEHLLVAPLPGFETHCLRGNHEDFLLRFLAEKVDAGAWLSNGGDATCLSYGFDPSSPEEEGNLLDWLQKKLGSSLPASHRAFFDSLKLSHEEGDYFFCHAGVRPGVALLEQSPEDLLWIREPFLESKADFGKIVVHGHTPTKIVESKRNRIGIDTGACYGGRLTAVVLERDGRRFLQA